MTKMQESNTSNPMEQETSPNYLHDLLLDRDHADPADLPAAEFLLEQSVRCFPGRTGKRYPCRGCYHNNLFYIV